jgi:UPF0042 nucleotide-binding protein
MSGSGKSFAAKCFEDMGYYCVDNLPIQLIPTFMDLIGRRAGDFQKVALVIDIREGAFLGEFPDILDALRRQDIDLRVIFFEATTEALIRRFSETRRPHPLAAEDSLEAGIAREREVLKSIRERADVMIDSSGFNVHEFRSYLFDTFGEEGRGTGAPFVSVVSFGYKYGLPAEADLLFDARFLPNPYFVDGLRHKTGLDPEVKEYLAAAPDYDPFYEKILELLTFLLPRFAKEGKAYVTIAIGCTGGRHRSVGLAERLGGALAGQEYRVRTTHRDMWKS